MQNERIIVILNLGVPDLASAIQFIHGIHACTLPIREQNSVFRDNVLVSRIYSRVTLNEIVKHLHKREVSGRQIFALPINQCQERVYDTYLPPHSVSLRELISDANEEFCVVNDNIVSTMTMNNQSFSVPGICAVTSPCGLFLAVASQECVTIYGNCVKFDEIHISGVTNMYFGNHAYLVIEYKDIMDYVSIQNCITGRKLFNGRIGKSKIGFLSNGFYIENTNKIFLKEESANIKSLISNNDYEKEKFVPTKLFHGMDESLIVKVYQHKNITAILTAEKIPHIVIIKDQEIIKRKNYVNLEDCKFISSDNRLYFLITKLVNERPLTTIETFSEDNFTFTQVDSFTDISVTDTSFVFVANDNYLNFYELDSVFILKAKIKKTHRLIFSLNPNGKVCVVYDYSSDKVEFYDSGKLISRHAHSNCTAVTWSQSGLYCATVSSGAGATGLVQVFNVNGKFIWKRLFNRLSTFAWKKFIENKDLLMEIEENYEKYCAEYCNDEEDDIGDNMNLEEEKRKWLEFLEEKKRCCLLQVIKELK